jgi:hypothetical protein
VYASEIKKQISCVGRCPTRGTTSDSFQMAAYSRFTAANYGKESTNQLSQPTSETPKLIFKICQDWLKLFIVSPLTVTTCRFDAGYVDEGFTRLSARTFTRMWARIASRYALDVPGIESRWGRHSLCPSRSVHPATCTMDTRSLSPGWSGRGCGVDHPPHPAPRLKKKHS